jgi:hypothetical protein
MDLAAETDRQGSTANGPRTRDVPVALRRPSRLGLRAAAIVTGSLCAAWLLARVMLPERPDTSAASWNFIGRDPSVQRLSGFAALALFALAVLAPARQRLSWLLRRRELSRLIHAGIGTTLCLTLLFHTGARIGRGLNGLLSWTMLALALMGVALALAWRPVPPQPPLVGHTLRPLHVWFWAPTLGLIAAHVLAVYYF